jgi:hypothetical protein
MNGIITIKIHVHFAYPRLFAQRKAQITKTSTMGDTNHSWQWRGGRGEDGPSSSIITLYFGFTNLTKKTNETQQMFIEYLVFYICKGL